MIKSLGGFCRSVPFCQGKRILPFPPQHEHLQAGCLTMGEPLGTTPITLLAAKKDIYNGFFFSSLVVKPALFLTPGCGTCHPVSPEVCPWELTEHATHCKDAVFARRLNCSFKTCSDAMVTNQVNKLWADTGDRYLRAGCTAGFFQVSEVVSELSLHMVT